MSFLNKILRKDIRWTGGRKKKESPVLGEDKKETIREEVKPTALKREFRLGVLLKPHATEKSTNSAGEDKYVFLVSNGSNKTQIKEAVVKRYGVEVLDVNILNAPGKIRRRGKQTGWKSGFKKAMVTLKPGQRIEIQ